MAGEDWLGGHAVTFLVSLGVRPGGAVDMELVDVGPYVPDMPHRAAILTPVTSPGDQAEGVLTTRGFQIRTRWDPNDPLGSEWAARRIHRLVKFADVPVWVGQVRLVAVVASSEPVVLPTDEDDPRTEYVQTHQVLIAEFDTEEM